MNDQKYVQYYVDILSSTLQDSILKNVSLQANLKIVEEVNADLQRLLEESKNFESQKDHVINDLRSKLEHAENEIKSIHHIKEETDRIRSELNHMDTFKRELLSSRQEVERLNRELEEAKSPKKKKAEQPKDGGNF